MSEWVRQTVAGNVVAVKTTDAMLDYISLLLLEVEFYRTTQEVEPANG